MVKTTRNLIVQFNNFNINEKDIRKEVNAELKRKKIKPKNKLMMYFNVHEWSVYCVIDDNEKIVVRLESK
jgi:hypothetical protein